jgi:hypothetical protein
MLIGYGKINKILTIKYLFPVIIKNLETKEYFTDKDKVYKLFLNYNYQWTEFLLKSDYS